MACMSRQEGSYVRIGRDEAEGTVHGGTVGSEEGEGDEVVGRTVGSEEG